MSAGTFGRGSTSLLHVMTMATVGREAHDGYREGWYHKRSFARRKPVVVEPSDLTLLLGRPGVTSVVSIWDWKLWIGLRPNGAPWGTNHS
jgi:hypothetical protein